MARKEMIEALEKRLEGNSSPVMESYRSKWAKRIETGEAIKPENLVIV